MSDLPYNDGKMTSKNNFKLSFSERRWDLDKDYRDLDRDRDYLDRNQ